MQLSNALQRFLVQLRADGRSAHTVGQYERHVRQLALWVDGQQMTDDVREFEPEHVAGFLASAAAQRRPDGKAKRAGSMNALRSSLRGFFEHLERSDVIERSPARVLRMARVGPAPPKGLRPDEVERLLATLVADPAPSARRDHALIAFLLGTGARLSSALALEVGDLDLEGGTAALHELKGGGSMVVHLRPELVALLNETVGNRRTGPVFAGRDGGRLTARHAQRRFDAWLAKAGVRGRFSPHSLRHTFAMGLYARTGDVLVVKEALGHRSITSTMVYARASAERVRAAVVG